MTEAENRQYRGMDGCSYQLSENELAGGGEGKLYKIVNRPNQVAKIFKEERRTATREEKLKKMVNLCLSEGQLCHVTWPQDIIYDWNGFAGYVMPLLENSRNLNMVYATGEVTLTYRNRLLIAHNLCAAVEEIHSLGQVCGDLNPQNISVNLNLMDKDAFHVTLVDADSYHFFDSATNTTYRCEVGLSEYIAPELQKKLTGGSNLKNAMLPTYTRETDLFALAVHVFALLMNGSHPFACAVDQNGSWENQMEKMTSVAQESVVLPQPIDNIKNGFFPFHQKREGITYPLYAPALQSLPVYLQELFIRTFEEGYENPERRVRASEWCSALRSFATGGELIQCPKMHWYASHNPACPWCNLEKRLEEMLKSRMTAEQWEEIPSSDQVGWETTVSESGGVGSESGDGGSGDVPEDKTWSRSLERGWGFLQLLACGTHWLLCFTEPDYAYNLRCVVSLGPLADRMLEPTAICVLSFFSGRILWQHFDEKKNIGKWCRFLALLWFCALIEITRLIYYDTFKGVKLLVTFFVTAIILLIYEPENK